MGPYNGPTFCEQHSIRTFLGTTVKAEATLQIDRFWAAQSPAGTLLLRFNLDETHIRMWPEGTVGTIVSTNGKLGRKKT